MLLAIDTSSFVLSCALAEKDKPVAEWTVQKRLTHSEQLIPHMDEILKDAGVDQKEITAIAAAKTIVNMPRFFINASLSETTFSSYVVSLNLFDGIIIP